MALYGEKTPPIVLMGHSMGGAIAVRAAAKGVVPALVGLAVIDVVEGESWKLGMRLTATLSAGFRRKIEIWA